MPGTIFTDTGVTFGHYLFVQKYGTNAGHCFLQGGTSQGVIVGILVELSSRDSTVSGQDMRELDLDRKFDSAAIGTMWSGKEGM